MKSVEYKQGYAAYVNKLGASSNPYHWDNESVKCAEWERGFEDAYYETDDNPGPHHRYTEEEWNYQMETHE